MNQAAQQISPSPAQRLADKIRARTNNGRDLIDLLHDIAQGGYDASNSDRVTASKYLFDRGYGKCPKQTPAPGPNPSPAPETEACPEPAEEGRGACPERSRRVTQIDRSLHDSLEPPPSAQPEGNTAASPESFDPFSIQDYIIEITNDGETLVDVLMDIAFAADDDSKVTPYCRSQAGRILSDRSNGTDPASVRNGLCPDCRRTWATHPAPDCHSERSAAESKNLQTPDSADKDVHSKEVWDGIIAELKQKEEAGILTPDPNAPKGDYSRYFPPKDFDMTPYAAEGAAKFRADNALKIERRKQWPAIEERRRKKLAQIYPSHSDDKSSEADPPDT